MLFLPHRQDRLLESLFAYQDTINSHARYVTCVSIFPNSVSLPPSLPSRRLLSFVGGWLLPLSLSVGVRWDASGRVAPLLQMRAFVFAAGVSKRSGRAADGRGSRGLGGDRRRTLLWTGEVSGCLVQPLLPCIPLEVLGLYICAGLATSYILGGFLPRPSVFCFLSGMPFCKLTRHCTPILCTTSPRLAAFFFSRARGAFCLSPGGSRAPRSRGVDRRQIFRRGRLRVLGRGGRRGDGHRNRRGWRRRFQFRRQQRLDRCPKLWAAGATGAAAAARIVGERISLDEAGVDEPKPILRRLGVLLFRWHSAVVVFSYPWGGRGRVSGVPEAW